MGACFTCNESLYSCTCAPGLQDVPNDEHPYGTPKTEGRPKSLHYHHTCKPRPSQGEEFAKMEEDRFHLRKESVIDTFCKWIRHNLGFSS